MTKNNKGTAMIRRRKAKPDAEFLSRVRKNQSQKIPTEVTSIRDENEEQFFHKQVLGSSVIAKIMASDKTIFLGLVVSRLVNAMLIQTSFVPDEFWQSVEVAHKMVFDYGYLTWEWRVGIRSYLYPLLFATLYKLLHMVGLDHRILLIRGPRLLQGLVGSTGDMYLYLLSARLAGREVAQWTVLCQLLSWFTGYCCTRTLSNGLETTLVTAALYYFPWPGYTQQKGHTRRFVLLAATAVVVRPTAAVLWILLCSWHLQLSKGPALWSVLRVYISAGLTVLGISTVIDRIWYGRWVFVHLNFLQFNVMSGGSGFYGRHPWHWYLSQGLPVVLGPHLLPFLLGAWRSPHKVLLMLLVWKVFVLSFLAHKEFRFLLPVLPLAMHYCGVYFHSATKPPPSPSPQKAKLKTKDGKTQKTESDDSVCNESPLSKNEDMLDTDADTDVKMCNGKSDIVEKEEEMERSKKKQTEISDSNTTQHAGSEKGKIDQNVSLESDKTAQDLSSKSENILKTPAGKEDSGTTSFNTEDESSEPQISPDNKEQRTKREKQRDIWRARRVRFFVLLLACSNLIPLLYFSLIHQRGTVDVMNYLHQAVKRSKSSQSSSSVDIMFLMPCHSTPYYSFLHANVSMRFLTCEPNLHHHPNYTDEADIFYQNPAHWLRDEYGDGGKKLPTHIVYFNVLSPSIAGFLQQGGYSQCAQFFHTHLPEGRLGSHVLVSCR